jgi:O-antigen ligase
MLYDNVTFGNFLNIGQLLVVLLPLAAAWLYLARTRRARLVAAGCMGLFLLHLFLTYSRGAILCTLAALAATVGLFWVTRHRSRWVVTALALLFVVLTFAAPNAPQYWAEQLFFLPGSTSWERIGFALRPLDFHAFMRGDRRAEYRLDPALVRARLGARYTQMLTVGLGHGVYGHLIGLGPDAGTHNLFVDALVSTGPLGLLGLIGLLVWAARNFVGSFRGVWRREPEPGAVLAFFVAGALANVAAIGVLSLYVFQYLRTSTGGIMFWLLLGLSVVLFRARADAGRPDEPAGMVERACF